MFDIDIEEVVNRSVKEEKVRIIHVGEPHFMAPRDPQCIYFDLSLCYYNVYMFYVLFS